MVHNILFWEVGKQQVKKNDKKLITEIKKTRKMTHLDFVWKISNKL